MTNERDLLISSFFAAIIILSAIFVLLSLSSNGGKIVPDPVFEGEWKCTKEGVKIIQEEHCEIDKDFCDMNGTSYRERFCFYKCSINSIDKNECVEWSWVKVKN